MAKSLLSNMKGNTLITDKKINSNVESLDVMKVPLVIAHRSSIYDLSVLNYYLCDINEVKVKSRVKFVLNFAKEIHKSRKYFKSDGTIENYIYELKRYISHCDRKGIDPFSKDGYLSYCGNWGELWKKVAEGHNKKAFIFLYEDEESVGLKEITAMNKRVIINSCLKWCGTDIYNWKKGLREFSVGEPNSALPYSKKELNILLERLQDFFYSISEQVLEYSKYNPEGLPPNKLIAKIKYHGSIKDVLVEAAPKHMKRKSGHVQGVFLSSPINKCMTAAYYLMAFYTALNDSTIRDIHRPLKVEKEKYNGKTVNYVTVKGYKGRAGKYMESILSDNGGIVSEIGDNNDNSLFLSINKRDGLRFINRLVLLSEAYNKNESGKLIYHLNNQGKAVEFRLDPASQLEVSLDILSDSRALVLNHLVNQFYSLVDSGFYTPVSLIKNESGVYVVNKKAKKLKGVKERALCYAYSVIKCFSDSDLKGALLPFSFSEKNDQGNISVSFKNNRGDFISFDMDYKYKPFIERLEQFSMQYINKKDLGTDISYMFPVYQYADITQWQGIQYINSHMLKDIGISNGDFFLDVQSSRFRVTTSDMEYRAEDNGAAARAILGHSISTQMTRYTNGHPNENSDIISQSLQVIEELRLTKNIDIAKEKVLAKNNIEVLSYDEYSNRRKSTNINGVYCEGESSVRNYRATNKIIEKAGIFNENILELLSCYEYDICFSCKSAKLVDDVDSVYKLISFIDHLEENELVYPVLENPMSDKINHFKDVLYKNIPYTTIELAMRKFDLNGRHFIIDGII